MKNTYLPYLVACIAVGAVAILATAASAVPFDVTNGATHVVVTPLAGPQSAGEFYDYTYPSGHPAFGTEANTAYFWLYEETGSGALSLGTIFNEHGAGGRGYAILTMSGLPVGAYFEVTDDPYNSFFLENGSAVLRYRWNNGTEGTVIGGLESGWDEITITSTLYSGIEHWYLLTGESTDPDMIQLNMEDPLLISGYQEVVPTPEPGTLFLLASGLVGIAAFRRRSIG